MQLGKVVLLECWRAKLLLVALEVKEPLKFRRKAGLMVFVWNFLFFFMVFLIDDLFD